MSHEDREDRRAQRSTVGARIGRTLADAVISERRTGLQRLLDGLDLVALDPAVPVFSAEPFPTALGTLDAIHLSRALMTCDRYPDLVCATHERAVATGGGAVGFRVVGAPA